MIACSGRVVGDLRQDEVSDSNNLRSSYWHDPTKSHEDDHEHDESDNEKDEERMMNGHSTT